MQIFFLGRWREHPSETGCKFPVTLFECMAVDAEGDGRIRMAQPVTDSHRVETGGDRLGSSEVAQRLKVSVDASLVGDALSELGNHSWTNRFKPDR